MRLWQGEKRQVASLRPLGLPEAAGPNSVPAAASRPGLEALLMHSGCEVQRLGWSPVKSPQREVTAFTTTHGQGVSDSP